MIYFITHLIYLFFFFWRGIVGLTETTKFDEFFMCILLTSTGFPLPRNKTLLSYMPSLYPVILDPENCQLQERQIV